MEIYHFNGGERERQPEKYPIKRELKKALIRSLDTVDNVLIALTHTGREGYLRDIRIEQIEKLKLPVFEYIEHRDQEAASGLVNAVSGLLQSQKAVVDTHHSNMREIALSEIINSLQEIEEMSFGYHLSLPVAQAFNIQQQTIEQLKLLNSIVLSADEPVTKRVIAIKQGVEVAFDQRTIAPIRFIEHGLDSLIQDAEAIDEQMTNMPEKSTEWRNAQAENNKLRQSLAQFI